jgi:hypothetical protein
VTNLPKFIQLTKHLIPKESEDFRGIYYLKGGEFNDELDTIQMKHKVYDLQPCFEGAFFETKKVIELTH